MRVLFGWTALAIAVFSAAVPAHARDAFPPQLASYASAQGATAGLLAVRDAEPAGMNDFSFLEAESAPVQSYWPVLYSALVPGLGEMSMGYWKRGIALMAVEIAAWTGYFVNHNEGMDKRDEYEAFADAHWEMQKWLYDHPCTTADSTLESVEECGQSSSGSGQWPGYIPWVPKEEDKQHYYENIGKYDWYISGWEDWDPDQFPYAKQTDLRTEYRSMRGESNDALDQANSFVWVSVAARAFSLAETAILVRNRRADGGGGGGEGAPVALRARPRGFRGGEVALEVRFK